jgi:hypothetical protein
MGHLGRCLALLLALASCAPAQTPGKATPGESTQSPAASADASKLAALLEANVKTEWDAFQKKDRKAYGDLLADDFVAVENDGEGTRTKAAVLREIDRSNIYKYYLFAFKTVPLNPDAALVTYELTMQFPPGALVRLKRVLVSELWIKRDGRWKQRYYQETGVK